MAALIQFASGAPGIKYSLNKTQFLIGRSAADNDVCVPCAFVSKRHAIIEAVVNDTGSGHDFYLIDLDSTNHTYVNEDPVTHVKLVDGDIIRIGKATFKFDVKQDVGTLKPVELDVETPLQSQSATAKLSRRLRIFGIDA
jgi:pSer/pThr/pTyr-binding forkhead associated (FHA) protein